MTQTVGRIVAAPLLFINLIMYLLVIGFTSWCINWYINGQMSHPSFGGNAATPFLLTFTILGGVTGTVSKLLGGNHIVEGWNGRGRSRRLEWTGEESKSKAGRNQSRRQVRVKLAGAGWEMSGHNWGTSLMRWQSLHRPRKPI